jgi:hypothetical protein
MSIIGLHVNPQNRYSRLRIRIPNTQPQIDRRQNVPEQENGRMLIFDPRVVMDMRGSLILLAVGYLFVTRSSTIAMVA